MTAPAEPDTGPGRGARTLVVVALLLLGVPGLVGFDAWPLTAWRLFSLSRDDSQTQWVLEATHRDGASQRLDLEALPLRYRHAAWPMAGLPKASESRRQEVCEALLDAVVAQDADVASVGIVRDRQRLVESGGDWIVEHAPETIHTCAVEPGP